MASLQLPGSGDAAKTVAGGAVGCPPCNQNCGTQEYTCMHAVQHAADTH